MAYQVLARKWRPANFEQVVGQQHVLRALTNALEHDRLHHAYLFTGTRGVGKTSIARLFAKGLNCEQGITATPCGQCSACQEISEGRFVDLMEIDAASRTKVDDTREILDNVQYQPVRGRFKVYLIDEVHMLSRHSFNALLKTLEEPPPHVKFLLATTDPQKLPVTVLSRCLQFNLKALSAEKIATHLDKVLTAEGVSHEPQALQLLAKAADGSVRDAMSLTDQAIAHGDGGVLAEQVQAMLGTLDSSYAFKLLQALVEGQMDPMMATLQEIEQFAPDYDELLKQLMELLHGIAMTQFSVTAAKLAHQPQQLLPFARSLSREQVQLWYQMLAQGRKDLDVAPDARTGLEMTLLRTLAFSPVTEVAPLQAGQPVISPPQVIAAASSSVVPALEQPQLATSASAQHTQPMSPPTTVSAAQEASVGAQDEHTLAAEQQMLMAQAEQLMAAPEDVTDTVSAASEAVPEPAVATDPESESVNQAPEAKQPPMTIDAPAQAEASEPSSPAEPTSSPTEPAPEPETSKPMSLMERALANRQRLSSRNQDSDAKKTSPQQGADDSASAVAQRLKKRTPPPRPEPVAEPVGDSVQPEPDSGQPANAPSVTTASPPEPVNEMPAHLNDAPPMEQDIPPWLPQGEAQYEPQGQPEVSVPAEAEPQVAAAPERPSPQPAASAAVATQPPAIPEVVETKQAQPQDMAWFQAIFDLGVQARARQLAINSLMDRDGDSVKLLLRPEQRHLMHDSVVTQITQRMHELWGEGIELQIEVGQDDGRETPLQIRRRLHQERLAEAKQTLLNDEHVNWLIQEFDAQLIDESINYK
ncbi:DNA polymerase III subunit gamma/tau [Ferrimonas aestuarii]|uniref:DNA-directed DNA polymerase n=1 Tax=Ferrimonas aestuarii TaxID=2569539 RepID=A0A4U1BMK0_9GAMM|nr:DNA polymerase III subunit gamma/tau [Ferrimonas aestuarii]TKB53975.1 DNA polymerase III subunit gamma/tau [Ferrimonas aestuarii]